MARKIDGYERPVFVSCHLCGGDIEVAPRGRIPDAHAACANARDMLRAAVRAMTVALDQAPREKAARLRTVWNSAQGNMQGLFNRADNPNKRR